MKRWSPARATESASADSRFDVDKVNSVFTTS